MKKKKVNKVKLSLFFIAIIIIISASMVSYVYFTVSKWDKVIYPGVKVETLNLSGNTKKEALEIIKQKYSDTILKKKIVIKAQGKDYTIDYAKLDAKYNINDVVGLAYNYGKNNGTFEKFKLIKRKKENKYNLKFDYNTSVVDGIIEGIKNDVNKKPKNSKISMDGSGNFNITSEEVGYQLKDKELKKLILEKINDKNKEDIINISAPIAKIMPKKTGENLKSINTLISSYQTSFKNSGESRVNNITLAAKSIDGTVVMPGEEFSFNDTVGERTAERGYGKAHVILNDEFVDDYGGGICQVSSTLYNALVRAKIDATERYSHTIASGYVDIGQDATVSWGGPDYKFKNNYDFPVYIQGNVYDKTVTFNIYSNRSLTKYKYKVYTADAETLEPQVTVEQDPNMFVGEEKVTKKSYTGHKAVVYRETYENDNLIKKDVLYKVNIKPINGVVKKGTKPR